MMRLMVNARPSESARTPETGVSVDAARNKMAARQDNRSWYTIGDMANEFGITLRALRFYEDKGLLKPHREGLARLYSAEDRRRLALILKGKRLGFTLSEIRSMIAAEAGAPDNSDLRVSREKCLEQIRHLEQQKRDIDAAIAELNDAASRLQEMIGDTNSR